MTTWLPRQPVRLLGSSLNATIPTYKKGKKEKGISYSNRDIIPDNTKSSPNS